jgi:hypothetical protein
MFFDHITSTHADIKSTDEMDDIEFMEMTNEPDHVDLTETENTSESVNNELIFQIIDNGDGERNYICPICRAEVLFDNVLDHMQTHNADSLYVMHIEPAPSGSLEDHSYVNDEFFNSKDINLTLRKIVTEQRCMKSESLGQVVERTKSVKSNILGLYSLKLCGDRKRYVCNITDDGSQERIPPVPDVVKRKINSLMKSESEEKIVEYQCGLCGNTYYKKDVILKCMEVHLSNGWTKASSVDADRNTSVSSLKQKLNKLVSRC